ncbi:MAG TPA: methyltransferase domain-containing protein [Candidatus Acidoferrales bacterium]|nr:methyltransferase domain-containing protein [Candidatus Acidoferrales bacterium]
MNMDKVHEMAFRVIGDTGGAFTVALGYIGDRLGLFKAMAGAGPMTSVELAKKTQLNERYVREWLRAMTAAEYVDYDPATQKYNMTEEQAFVLANEDSPLFVGGVFHFTAPSIRNADRIAEAFKNGGGIPYSEIGDEIPHAIERLFRPGYLNFLAKDWLGSVPGLVERLNKGASVVDIGCGHGQSTVTMGKNFPNSQVLGIDYHAPSIERARNLAAKEGVKNVEFVQAAADKIPNGKKYDLICSFDCIHDMVDPKATLKAIRNAMADDGVYVWSEPNASDKAHENRNPVGKMFHAISPLHCMTVSLAYNGAGLGTVIGEQGARELAKEAGFSHFEKLPIQHPLNQFFALRK